MKNYRKVDITAIKRTLLKSQTWKSDPINFPPHPEKKNASEQSDVKNVRLLL